MEPPQEHPTGPPPLGVVQLLYAAAVVGVPLAVAGSLSLGLSQDASIAAFRACVQLTILATCILGPLLRTTRPELVLLYVGFMCAAAGREGSSKLSWRYPGALQHCIVAAAIGSGTAVFIGIAFIIQPKPWFSATTLIPVAGMVLGNGLNAVAVGLRTYLEELGDHPDRAQLSLSFGASPFEALLPVARSAFKTALTPAINSMAVSGLVSIPGMMTGQVLAGQDPVEASRYQIMITYLIAGGAFTAVGVAVLLASRTLFDHHGRFCSDLLMAPQSSQQSSQKSSAARALNPDKCSSSIHSAHELDPVPTTLLLHQRRVVLRNARSNGAAGFPSESAAVVLAGTDLHGRVRDRLLFKLLSLTLVEGEICVVCGASGRGKTRLLSLLNASCPFSIHGDGAAGMNTLTLRGEGIAAVGGPAWRRRVLLGVGTRNDSIQLPVHLLIPHRYTHHLRQYLNMPYPLGHATPTWTCHTHAKVHTMSSSLLCEVPWWTLSSTCDRCNWKNPD
eukprot:m.696582 g.696582  ORF g.696582 m.696582 type:complete len:504 (-) comp22893_c0_seq14:3061-4572(-)